MIEKSKYTIQIGPMDIEMTKNTVDGGYNVWIYIYPTGKPRPNYVELGEIGHHDVKLGFIYVSDLEADWCDYEEPIKLDSLMDEALKTTCSNDEDLYKVEASIVLHSSNGPSVHYKAYKQKIGDRWTRWKQDVLAIGFWVPDEVGGEMIERLIREASEE